MDRSPLGYPMRCLRLLASCLLALLAFAGAAAAAQFAGSGGTTGISLAVADWVPPRDKDYGGWGVVPAGAPIATPLQWTKDAETLELPPGDYDVYWVQDFETREAPMLVAGGVKVDADKLTTVMADTGVKLEVAAWLPARNKDYGWWGATRTGEAPDKRINWTKAAEALLLPPATYDIYWVQDFDTRDRPLAIATGVAVAAGQVVTVRADSGVQIAVASWVPARDKDYGWWGAARTGEPPDKWVNWTKAAESLLLPPATYDIYWVQDFDTRDRPLAIATGVAVAAGQVVTVRADSGVRIAVASWVPARDKDYGWWGAARTGEAPDKWVNWTKAAEALLLPPAAYDIYWVQDFDTRDRPLAIATGVAVAAGQVVTVKADSGVQIAVASWVPARDKDYGWWGAARTGEAPDKWVNWTKAAEALLLPPAAYDVYWVQDFNTRDRPILVAQGLEVRPGEFSGVGLELSQADDVIKVVHVLEGGPAARAGIQPDDVLVTVGGESLKGKTLSQAVERLRGASGEAVAVSIQRANAAQPIDVTIERAVVTMPPGTVRIDSGIRPVVAADVPPLDEDSGWWGAAPAWQGPDSRVNWSSGRAADPIMLPPGTYDVYWQPSRSEEPQLKAKRIVVAAGALVDVAIGLASIEQRPSRIVGFQISAPDGIQFVGGTVPVGVKQIEARYEWKGADVGYPLGVRWYLEDEMVLEQGEPVAKAEGEMQWVLRMEGDEPLPPGGYRVELMENGEVRTSSDFAIAAARASDGGGTAAPTRSGDATGDRRPAVTQEAEATTDAATVAALPAAPVESGSFAWQDKTEDKVGTGDVGTADGTPDGHFTLQLRLPQAAEIAGIAVYGADASGAPAGGQSWDSADPSRNILGVHNLGLRLNSKHVSSLGVHKGDVTFDLYAADSGGFQQDENFLVEVIFADGSKWSQVAMIGTPPEAVGEGPAVAPGEGGAGTGGEWVIVQAASATAPDLADDFSDPKSGWTVLDTDTSDVGYAAGAYRIALESDGPAMEGGFLGREIGDAVLQVDVTDASGSFAHPFGVVVRAKDGRNYHFFIMASDGSYATLHTKDDQKAMEASGSLPAGAYRTDAPNRIQVFMIGDMIVYFVNGREVDRARALWPSGLVGVLSINPGAGKSEVIFDDWKVWLAK